MKKLLIALGLSSALILSPALAQTSSDTTTAPAADASKTTMKSDTAKPKHHKHHKHHKTTKAKPMSKSKSKTAPKPKSDAPADAPKT